MASSEKMFTLPVDDPEDRVPGVVVGKASAAHMKKLSYEVLVDIEIGLGFFASVFEAKMGPMTVACKVQPSDATARREVDAIKRIGSHQNIVQVFGIFEPPRGHRRDGKVYIFMELMAITLNRYVQPKDGLEEEEAKFLFKQIATGVEYIHSLGYAHCDLKPANILLDETKQVVKLTDFGNCVMAKVQSYNSQADVFDMGVILYFIFRGNETIFSRNISDEAEQFIRFLKKEKPTAFEVLEHEWMSSPRDSRTSSASSGTSGHGPELPLEPRDLEPFPGISEEFAAMFDALVHQHQPSVTLSPSDRDHRDLSDYRHNWDSSWYHDPDEQDL